MAILRKTKKASRQRKSVHGPAEVQCEATSPDLTPEILSVSPRYVVTNMDTQDIYLAWSLRDCLEHILTTWPKAENVTIRKKTLPTGLEW